ncbi:MAG TPA: hypothetical protein DD640_08375 [Clostridiales bacterium]|nr:hypothetical protein [Clostridiales bacterium]
MIEFKAFQLHKAFTISEIMSFYYMEVASSFSFPPQRHDFWEMVYVDKGELQVETAAGMHRLPQGQIIFHEPQEYHVGKAIRNTAPNLVVLTFACDAACLSSLRGKIFQLNPGEREVLACLIREGTRVFNPPIDSPDIRYLERRDPAPFAGEQVICNYLEIFLILLLRRADPLPGEETAQSALPLLTRQDTGLDLINQVIRYLSQHTAERLSVEQLCQLFYTSRSYLMSAFKQRTQHSPMEYFNLLKIDRGKSLIRAGRQSLSQIAEQLSYRDLGSFSRQFKKITGMSPTEYRRLIKS